ncbi:calcium-binding protein [Rhizobium laguerreae]|uniref:calcium-binding protein n=1 Tax=Rhizobium laguerreae TaxID=1076926 RepID=UPI001C91EDD0|nr:calcium-binding protein [Rhizobium laguerreae]MBY3211812.1 calcium-binding protein [Rhizobium laguerreae]
MTGAGAIVGLTFGGAAGALIGGAAGAAVGGAAGAFFGPGGAAAGIVWGGRVGGMVGTAMGGTAGQAAGAWAGHWAGDFFFPDPDPHGAYLPDTPPWPIDPLILDLSGTGFTLESIQNTSAHFDFEQDGFAESTGWITGTTALLVNDLNHNGDVDSVSELIGGPDQEGFDALAVLDTNLDGIVDSSDAQFGSLRLWLDANGDGNSDAGELHLLSEFNVAGIETSRTPSSIVENGNTIAYLGNFVRTDGSRGQAGSVLFETNPTFSVYQPPDNFELADDVYELPNLFGYGMLKSLAVAMTEDAELKEFVSQFVLDAQAMSFDEYRASVEALILKWAGVEDVEASSRGSYVNAQHLAVVEKAVGHIYFNGDNPTYRSGLSLEEDFSQFVDSTALRLMIQIPTSKYYLIREDFADDASAIAASFGKFAPFSTRFIISHMDTVDPVEFFTPSGDQVELEWTSSSAPLVSSFLGELMTWAKNAHQETGAEIIELLAFASVLRSENIVGDDEFSAIAVLEAERVFAGDKLQIFIASHSVIGDIVTNADEGGSMTGTDSADGVWGYHGDDALNGGAGNDTYVYARGDGNDTIIEADDSSTDDQLVLIDLNPADVTLVRNGNDVTLVIAESAAGAGDGGSILLSGNLNEYYQTGLEKVVFADGTTWGRADLRSNISYVGGTSGNDIITGTTGADTIHAGLGDDTLIGLAGDDAFVFRPGFGHDTINDFVAGAQSIDVIDFSTEIFADFASVLAAASQLGADTVITHDANTSITLKNVALTSLHQDDFRFTAAA